MGKKFDPKYDNRIGPELFTKEKGKKQAFAKLFVIIGCIWIWLQTATQYFASVCNYHQLLGAPLAGHFYAPTKILAWQQFIAQYPQYAGEYRIALSLGMMSGMLFLLLGMAVIYSKNSKLKGEKYLYGSARWANKEDIVKMGLIPQEYSWLDKLKGKLHGKTLKEKDSRGVFVGGWIDPKTKKLRYLRHNGKEQVLIIAPTRSGKGVALVNPTLLTWEESAFIYDLKGELWHLSAGARQKIFHNRVMRFEPALKRKVDENGHANVVRWNPFAEIRSKGDIEYYYDGFKKELKTRQSDGSQEVGDAQNIALMIADPESKGLDDHWVSTAYALITGCILHLKHNLREYASPQTLDMMLSGLIDFAEIRANGGKFDLEAVKEKSQQRAADEDDEESSSADGFKNVLADMALGLDWKGEPEDNAREVIKAAQEQLARPDEEAGSVLSTAITKLSLYRDPIVAENTSVSDFKVLQLMNSADPVSLYLITSPSDKDRIKPLSRLLFNSILKYCCADMEFAGGRSVDNYAHRLLFLADELPSLGKIDIIQSTIAFQAGYGIKGYYIIQDLSQLYNTYGDKESITSNCHVQIWYAPLRMDTCEAMSKAIGTTTIMREKVSISGSGFKASKSRSMEETQRALMTPDECRTLPGPIKNPITGDIEKPGAMVITVAGYPPIYGIQPLYFKNPILLKRASIPAPECSDKLPVQGQQQEDEDDENAA